VIHRLLKSEGPTASKVLWLRTERDIIEADCTIIVADDEARFMRAIIYRRKENGIVDASTEPA